MAFQLSDTLYLPACACNVGCPIRHEAPNELADDAAIDSELLGAEFFTFLVKGAAFPLSNMGCMEVENSTPGLPDAGWPLVTVL